MLHEHDYTGYKKLAVWFGNEKRGISPLAVESSILCITIPMYGIVESLNLGSSSGIVLYEIAKQRRAFQLTHKRALRPSARKAKQDDAANSHQDDAEA